jgi:hypothetical protein
MARHREAEKAAIAPAAPGRGQEGETPQPAVFLVVVLVDVVLAQLVGEREGRYRLLLPAAFGGRIQDKAPPGVVFIIVVVIVVDVVIFLQPARERQFRDGLPASSRLQHLGDAETLQAAVADVIKETFVCHRCFLSWFAGQQAGSWPPMAQPLTRAPARSR